MRSFPPSPTPFFSQLSPPLLWKPVVCLSVKSKKANSVSLNSKPSPCLMCARICK
uniref:Uncharacterized protein n=1 Tax=Anguilla anguilla TaxID=7936 RepID=A0A0E9WFA4_ANGAN